MQKRYRTSLGLLAVVLTGNCSYSESPMSFDKLTYNVAEMMGPPQSLTISSDGAARYESHSNASMPDNPEIGLYESRLSPTDMEALQAALKHTAFDSLPDHSGRIAAGDRYKEVTVVTGADKIRKLVGTSEPVDASLAKLLERLDHITTEIMKQPVHTLRMDRAHFEIDPAGTLTLGFFLSGGGREAIEFANPTSPAGGAGLYLRGWPDKPPAQFGAGEVFGVNINQVSQIESRPEGRPPGTIERLSPGNSVSFRGSTRISVPTSGTYILQLRYQNTVATQGAPSVLIGEILSKPMKLKLTASPLK